MGKSKTPGVIPDGLTGSVAQFGEHEQRWQPWCHPSAPCAFFPASVISPNCSSFKHRSRFSRVQ